MWHREQQGKPPLTSPAETVAKAAPSGPAAGGQPKGPCDEASLIGQGLRLKGELEGREDFYIDGHVEGSIRLEDAIVTVGSKGRVTADIEAREIVVHGNVQGNLRGRDRVRIGSTGTVSGDVVTQRIAIKEGAMIRGRVDVGAARETRTRRAARVVARAELPRPVAVHAKESGK